MQNYWTLLASIIFRFTYCVSQCHNARKCIREMKDRNQKISVTAKIPSLHYFNRLTRRMEFLMFESNGHRRSSWFGRGVYLRPGPRRGGGEAGLDLYPAPPSCRWAGSNPINRTNKPRGFTWGVGNFGQTADGGTNPQCALNPFCSQVKLECYANVSVSMCPTLQPKPHRRGIFFEYHPPES